jgi:hypothetical protein
MAHGNFTPDVEPSPRARYSLGIRILHLQQRDGFLFFHDHLETTPEWSDHLIVDVGPSTDNPAGEYLWAAWESEFASITSATDPISANPKVPANNANGILTFEIPLPRTTNIACLLFGDRAAIRLIVEPWQ